MPGKLRLLSALLLAKSPEPVAAMILAGRRRVVDGRRCDAKAEAVGRLAKLVRDSGGEPDLEEGRRGLEMMAAKFDGPCPPMVRREDIELPGADGQLPARLYDANTASDGTPRPTLLFLHGGGWVQGSLDTHDGLCGRLAARAGIRVISYAYRLAPEHKFPAGLDDVRACYDALRDDPGAYGIDPDRMAVGGDSAGGNLTAALMHDLVGDNAPLPAAQVLIYPALDTRLSSPSMQALRDGYVLPSTRIKWYLEQYLPDGQDMRDPRLAPVFSDRLAGQPPALIVVAGQDPLWDDGRDYAGLLREAGVEVDLAEYPGQIHAFLSLTRVIPQGTEATDRVAAWLADRLGKV